MTALAALASRLNPVGHRRLPAVLQTEATECGLACLAMVAGYHGLKTDLGSLRREHGTSLKGTTLASVAKVAQRLGLGSRALRLEPAELLQLRLPAILHWNLDHFVVLKAVRSRQVVIHDPAVGSRTLPLDAAGALPGRQAVRVGVGDLGAKEGRARCGVGRTDEGGATGAGCKALEGRAAGLHRGHQGLAGRAAARDEFHFFDVQCAHAFSPFYTVARRVRPTLGAPSATVKFERLS